MLFYLLHTGIEDFSNGTYDVTFEVGAPFPLEGCVEIPTLQDDGIEGYEHFTVSVSGTSPNDAVTMSESSTHVITILDDDGMKWLYMYMYMYIDLGYISIYVVFTYSHISQHSIRIFFHTGGYWDC